MIVDELIALYDESPDLALYKKDLISSKHVQYIEEIAGKNTNGNLNPIEIVLESLINVVAEKLSIDTLTQSKKTVYVDKSLRDSAVKEISGMIKRDTSFLKNIHDKWLENLQDFVSKLPSKGVETVQEAVFQISLQFRISASSALKTIASLI